MSKAQSRIVLMRIKYTVDAFASLAQLINFIESKILLMYFSIFVISSKKKMTNYFKYLPENILTKKIEKGEFPFSQNLFWDTPLEKIDIIKHKSYIIERVLSRGLLKDFYFLLQLYTTEEITIAVKNSNVLDRKTINFCSLYFRIPLNELHASSYYN